jgi:CheY-like chemotaxis protein
LESLGLLAGGIAHDFNNLLTAILGNADLVERELPVGSDHRARLDEIVAAARVASDLCRQMLAYAGKRDLVLGAIDVGVLIENMRGLLESSVSRKISLRFDLHPTPLIDADASQVQQVLLNLVINAAEAIGDRPGEVTISTGAVECSVDELAEPYLDHDLPAGNYTFVEVRDPGVGIPDAIRARIFDPFFSTKFTGRGLGLSAVLGIVRAHRGSIKIESAPGHGTSSRVLFPVAVDKPVMELEPETRAKPEPRDGATVLCIDDDEFVRSTMSAMLGRLGFETMSAASGFEAVRLFADRQDHIDCVILDLTMPEMDGIETFERLRELDPNVKVVLVSGYDESEATREFVGHGLTAFMQKPFAMAALDATLRAVLE